MTTRWLCDENIPRALVLALREREHDVAWVTEVAPGSTDRTVLALAIAEQRVLLTFDKDFGELAFRASLPPSCGIVLLRLPMHPVAEIALRVADALTRFAGWNGHFAVLDSERLRIRPL